MKSHIESKAGRSVRIRPEAAFGLAFVGLLGCTGIVSPSGAAPANQGGQSATGMTGAAGSGGAAVSDMAGGGGTQACTAGVTSPGASPIRRLSRSEYNNTVADLLGDTTGPANGFTAEEVALGYTNNADVQTVSDLLEEQYETAAVALAKTAIPVGSQSKVLGCDAHGAAGADACAHSFIDSFGKKAYRRPLTAEESQRIFQFYGTSATAYGVDVALQMTLEAMLQSPHFLYRVEDAPPDGAVRRVTGYELASRLSYLMWASMPDDVLFQAAASGALDSPGGVEAQARRMLLDPKINRSMGEFFSEWLELDTLDRASRDATMFPAFTSSIKAAMRTETERFTTDVVFNGSGDLNGLLLGTYTFLNKPLADYYGVSGPKGDAFERVELDTTKRLGLLSQGSVMAAHANSNQTSPVARGFFIRDRFLCTPPPPPPATIKVTPPEFDPTVSTRERFALHRAQPLCATCHQLMDPVGLGFENFDAVGRYRSEEAGKPIDATGEVFSTDDIDGPFNGAGELSAKLAQSAMTRACLVKQWFRFGYGRGEAATDTCTLSRLNDAFAKSKGNFRELVVNLTQTDAFLYRTNETGAMK
jgi:hypothetical protein